MITLCMDTSHRHLVLALLKGNQVVASCVEEAWKKQSETIFVRLIALMQQENVKVEDIEKVVITNGPGSYTGIRIAMSIAKVLCTRKHIPLYTISTLQLYAGLEDVHVILDARSSRVYYGLYTQGRCVEIAIKTLDEVEAMQVKNIVGDVEFIGLEKTPIDFVSNFANLQEHWEKVDNIHTLVPMYLKEESAYLVK